MIIYLSGFAKRYLQDFVATVSFDAVQQLTIQYEKNPDKLQQDRKKTGVYNAVYIFPHPPPPLPYLSFTSFSPCHKTLLHLKSAVSFDAVQQLTIQYEKNPDKLQQDRKKTGVYNAVYIFPHPPPPLPYLSFTSFSPCHKTLLHLKSASAVLVVFRGRLIFQVSLWPPAAKFSGRHH